MRGHGKWRALLVVALVTAQGCWLQSGFDGRRSGFNGGETGITSATVARLAPAWTATVGGSPDEPIVFDGSVFVRGGGQVTALAVASGAVRWTSTGVGGGGRPLLAGNRLWVPTGGGHCEIDTLSLGTGAVVGSRTIGGPELNGVGGSGFSFCSTGDALWAGSRVATVWTYAGGAPAPRACGTNLFVAASGNGISGLDVDDPSVSFDTNTVIQTCTVPPPIFPLPGPLSSDGASILTTDDTAVTGYPLTCSGFNCSAMFHWTTATPMVPTIVPLASGGEAAVVQRDGHVAVVDTHTGAVHWTGSLGAAGAASLPPAVTDTTIFAVADDGTLSAFPVGGCGASTCPATWTAALPAAATGRPSIVGDVLYVGGSDGTLSAFAASGCGAATCSPLFTATVPGAVSGSPVADGGTLFVASSTGTITAFRAPA
jgi:PQQ-like domain